MMRIAVLSRGGLGVYGGLYDPHCNEAVLQVRDGETTAITVEYPSAPTSPAVVADGVTATTPTVATGTNKVTMTLSGANDDSKADLTATVDGEVKLVRIRCRAKTPIDDYDFWPEPYL